MGSLFEPPLGSNTHGALKSGGGLGKNAFRNGP